VREPKPSKLKDKVRELLGTTEYTLAEIAEACDVSVPWIARLKGSHGDYENPSVDRMEELYEFLSGKELKL
jgi:predicted transcriptional regulator